MSTEIARPAIGEAEEVTVTLPAASGWADAVGDDGYDCTTPYWRTSRGHTTTAWVGGVECGRDYDEEGDYDENLAALREGLLAKLAAVNAAERYQARRETS